MKFLQIENPREIIPIGCRLLKLVGLGSNEDFKIFFWLQGIVYLLFSIIPRLFVEIDSTAKLLRQSSEIVFVSYASLQYVALYIRRRSLFQLVGMLKQTTDTTYSEDIESFFIRSNAKINRSSIAYTRFFLFISVLYCTMSPLASCLVYIRNMRNEMEEPEEFIISSEMNLYNLDIRYNALHYSIYTVLICILCPISSLTLCTKDVFDFAAIKATTLMFEITARQIRELCGQITQEQLCDIIKSHCNTLFCMNQLQEALNYSVLFQFATCSAIWCFMMFYILLMGLDSRILSIVLLLVLVSIETYTYCTLGSQLTEKGEDLLITLQQLSWYEQPVVIQRQILLMIRCSQVPIVLKAGKLFRANVVQFSEIVQKSYSFFVVLKNVF